MGVDFSGRGLLLDVEGTTSSVSFVAETMFPFVRRELHKFLAARWEDPAVVTACDLIARDAGHASLEDWLGPATDDAAADDEAGRRAIEREVARLMDVDAKRTGLKQLQGLIWEAGFASGELRAHVYPDVVPALEAWRQAGCDIRIYSSGSIQTQKLFFGHSEQGDLLRFFSGHYDTTIGSKRESPSYRAIAKDWGLAAEQILFLSDIPAEIEAATQAGLQVGLCLRPGNAPAPAGHTMPTLASFGEVRLTTAAAR